MIKKKKIVKEPKSEFFLDLNSKYIAAFLWDYFAGGGICNS